jgi:uncharacterized protein (DUF4415 family)
MSKQRVAKGKDSENPIWTEKDFAKAVPFSGLPKSLQTKLSARKRGPQKSPTKIPVSIRLSSDVVEALRATGEGWQTRADEALRLWLSKQKKIAV